MTDTITENIYELLDTSSSGDVLLEASSYRSKILKKLDIAFKNLKKNHKSVKNKKKIEELIKEFTDIKKINIILKEHWWNFSIIPIYSETIVETFFHGMLRVAANKLPQTIDEKKLTKLKKAEESSKYIDKIYVIIGIPMLIDFSSKQFTAMFLHDIAHVFYRTSNWSSVIPTIGKAIRRVILPSLFVSKFIIKLPIMITSPIAFSFILGIHGLSFIDTLGEKNADNYTTKYGYGDELVKIEYSLYKMGKIRKKRTGKFKLLFKIWGLLEKIFTPDLSPSDYKRLKNLKNKITDEYTKLYPDLSKEIKLIFQDIH